MSLINQLNATTEYFWMNTEPQDIVNKASALLWKLMGNALERDNWEVKPHETVDGGLMIKVPLEYTTSNSGAYGAATVINQSKKSIIDAARFRWAGVYGSNTLNLVSIHAPAWGATSVDLFFFSKIIVSIHAPAWGATESGKCTEKTKTSFNPRARMGRDFSDIVDGEIENNVSIHAPAWGATASSPLHLSGCFVSIHAPAWGATCIRRFKQWD